MLLELELLFRGVFCIGYTISVIWYDTKLTLCDIFAMDKFKFKLQNHPAASWLFINNNNYSIVIRLQKVLHYLSGNFRNKYLRNNIQTKYRLSPNFIQWIPLNWIWYFYVEYVCHEHQVESHNYTHLSNIKLLWANSKSSNETTSIYYFGEHWFPVQ